MKAILALFLAISTAHAQSPVVTAYNQFGFKLLAELVHENPAKNVFVSPASLAFALSMVASGAQGETLREIRATLGVTNEDWNAANRQLLDRLARIDPNISLEIANAIWVDNKAAIKPAFLKENEQTFQAKIANGDFQNPATVDAINQWVSDRTHGKIRDIVTPPLDPLLRLILLDAVYFKGEWASKFDQKLTQDKPFTTGAGASISHPRMMKVGKFGYFENEQFQAVTLPYGDGAIAMTVLLSSESLGKTVAAAASFPERFVSRQGALELPRFKLENSYQLIPALHKLGLTLAFDLRADFGGISDEALSISDVKQKTFVDVNEEGTEAAAVTSIFVAGHAVMREPPPFTMVVNHPFFVVIKDSQTGLILFLGAIQDPR